MQLNPPTPTATPSQQQIQQIITNSYVEKDQDLCLSYGCPEWKQVILARSWTKLRSLDLQFCGVYDSGAKVLGQMCWPDLQILILGWNKISSTGFQNLFNTTYPKLKQLYLKQNKFGDKGMEVILTNAHKIPKLQYLYVDKNDISDAGLLLMPGVRMEFLRELELSFNYIGSKGIKLITKSELPSLQVLRIQNWDHEVLGHEGYLHLSKGKWPNLTKIFIAEKAVQYDWLPALVQNCWTKLEHIRFSSIYWVDGISYMSFVATNWAANFYSVHVVRNTKIKKAVENIFRHRYAKK